MKNRKKLKAASLLLCIMLAASVLAGCGKAQESKSESSREITGTTQKEASVDTNEIEIREIEEREWEEKATIALGGKIAIDGSGAEVVENVISISEGGSYEISGTLADGMIYIETEEAVRLVLNGASITSTTGPAIFAYDSEEVWIEVADGTENTLEDGTEYVAVYEETTTTEKTAATEADATTEKAATETTTTEEAAAAEETADIGKGTIFSNDDLIFTGTGTLTVTGNYKHGICSDDSVYFQNGTIQLTAIKDGVHVNDAIVLNGGTIQVSNANDGMESEGLLVVNGGTYTANVADDGLTAAGDLTVNEGTIQITSCMEGVESKANLIINGGTIEVTGKDDGLNATSLIQINDGLVYANISNGDGVDSNGQMEINGGIVIALGSQMPEGGADCDDNTFRITGGVLIATGGTNSSPTEAECTQASVLLGSAQNGDAIGIKDADGNTVFAFNVSKAYSNLLLSGDFLVENSSYTVYTGGTINGTETAYGYYANAEYEGGTESVAFTVDGMVVSAGGTAGMMGGGMQGGGMFGGNRGEKPENGELPEGMEIPENGEMPEGMEPPEGMEKPENGEMQEGMEPPEGMELPEGMEKPENGELPEGMEKPENGEMPEGMEKPEGAQIPEDGNSSDTSGATPETETTEKADDTL